MEGALLLDIVVRKSATILKLLACKNQALLVRRNSLLILDLRFDIIDRVARLDFQGNCLTRQSLHEDLHPSSQSQHEMEGRLLLDIVVREGPPVLKLLAGEDKTLLVRGNALLVLDLAFNVINRVARLDFEGDCLASECLHKDLHPSTQPEHQVESRLLLDVVIGQRAAVLELLARKDEALLIWRNSFLILDLTLDIVNRVRALHLEGDGLASERLYEDLHGWQ